MRDLDMAYKLAEKLDGLDIATTEHHLLTALELSDDTKALLLTGVLKTKLTSALQLVVVIESLLK